MKKVREIDLAVHGSKAALLQKTHHHRQEVKAGKVGGHDFKQLQIKEEQRPATAVGDNRREENSSTYREVFKLSTARLSVSAVQSKQLKEIRESVEIENLKRLLRLLAEERGGDGRGGIVVTSVDSNKIYKEFFQVHYDILRDVLDRSS